MEFATRDAADAENNFTGEVSPLGSPISSPIALRGQPIEKEYDSDELAEHIEEGDGVGFNTPSRVSSGASCRSLGNTGGTDASGISLTDIEQELHEIIAKVNSGATYDEKRLDFLIALQNEHPEHQARQLEELREWTNSVEDYLAECLVAMRTFVPVNVACSSKDQMIAENEGLSVEVVKRIHEKKCLWLCRLSVDDIDRLHDIELRDRYNPTAENLDIVELSAVYASFPEEFTSDTSGKKTELKLAVMHQLQRLLKQKEDLELPENKIRHPAYGSEEYGPIEDIVSTYSTRVVSGISNDEWSGAVAPRRSFQDVCGRHSILSVRKASTEKRFTNVFAEYSGPDLVHCGWLKKETGTILSIYQSRYCVLTRNDKMLRYFKREDDTDTQGTCDLSTIVSVYPNVAQISAGSTGLTSTPSPTKAPLVAGSNQRFQLINNAGKFWTFEATTTEARDEWVEHIQYVIRAAPETNRISISDIGGSSDKYSNRLSFGSNKSASPRTPLI